MQGTMHVRSQHTQGTVPARQQTHTHRGEYTCMATHTHRGPCLRGNTDTDTHTGEKMLVVAPHTQNRGPCLQGHCTHGTHRGPCLQKAPHTQGTMPTGAMPAEGTTHTHTQDHACTGHCTHRGPCLQKAPHTHRGPCLRGATAHTGDHAYGGTTHREDHALRQQIHTQDHACEGQHPGPHPHTQGAMPAVNIDTHTEGRVCLHGHHTNKHKNRGPCLQKAPHTAHSAHTEAYICRRHHAHTHTHR